MLRTLNHVLFLPSFKILNLFSKSSWWIINNFHVLESDWINIIACYKWTGAGNMASNTSEKDQTRLNKLSYKRQPFWHSFSFKVLGHSENYFIQIMKNWLLQIKCHVNLPSAYRIQCSQNSGSFIPVFHSPEKYWWVKIWGVWGWGGLWRHFFKCLLYLYAFVLKSGSIKSFKII